jgi:hypothetical protein
VEIAPTADLRQTACGAVTKQDVLWTKNALPVVTSHQSLLPCPKLNQVETVSFVDRKVQPASTTSIAPTRSVETTGSDHEKETTNALTVFIKSERRKVLRSCRAFAMVFRIRDKSSCLLGNATQSRRSPDIHQSPKGTIQVICTRPKSSTK